MIVNRVEQLTVRPGYDVDHPGHNGWSDAWRFHLGRPSDVEHAFRGAVLLEPCDDLVNGFGTGSIEIDCEAGAVMFHGERRGLSSSVTWHAIGEHDRGVGVYNVGFGAWAIVGYIANVGNVIAKGDSHVTPVPTASSNPPAVIKIAVAGGINPAAFGTGVAG